MGSNSDSGSSSSSSSSNSCGESFAENSKQENLIICLLYFGMSAGVILQSIFKLRKKGKVKTHVAFMCEVFILSVVRIFYSAAPSSWWVSILHSHGGVGSMVLIDMLPEIIFMSTYLLLITSWWLTRSTAQGAQRFSSPVFWMWYVCVIGFLVVVVGVIAIITWVMKLRYSEALLCESIVIGVLCFFAGVAALIIGLQLLWMLQEVMTKSTYLTHVKKQVSALLSIAVLNFLLKAAFLFTIPTMQEQHESEGKWNNVSFPLFWDLYCVITEIIPFYIMLLVLLRKDPSEAPTQVTSETENELLRNEQMNNNTTTDTNYAKKKPKKRSYP